MKIDTPSFISSWTSFKIYFQINPAGVLSKSHVHYTENRGTEKEGSEEEVDDRAAYPRTVIFLVPLMVDLLDDGDPFYFVRLSVAKKRTHLEKLVCTQQ